MKVSNNIKVIRWNLNLSLRELEKLSGISRTTIYRLENYFSVPNQLEIYNMSKVLKENPCNLFELDDHFVKL